MYYVIPKLLNCSRNKLFNRIKTIKQLVLLESLAAALLLMTGHVSAASSNLPLLQMNTLGLEYKGAFRIKNETVGDGRIAFTTGEFAVTPGAESFYIVGTSLSLAQYSIPILGKRAGEGAAINSVPAITSLPIAPSPIQPFTKLLPKVPTGNPDGLDRVTGMEIANGKLVINWLKFYDGAVSTTDTTLVIDTPTSLSTSKFHGFQKLQGTGHVTGWISKVPPELQEILDTGYLFGYANNYAINARLSMGPTAFAVNMPALLAETGNGKIIPTTPYLDFSVTHPLRADEYNTTGTNDVWTEVSTAEYGFIVPGTRTYLVIGTSGGHESGIGYKILQGNGKLCGGPCPKDFHDSYNYAWLWDVNDLIAVKEGRKERYEVEPYAYGKLSLPYQPAVDDPKVGFHGIIGADYDPETQQLFMLLGEVDQQNAYESAPLMLVYKMSGANAVPAESNTTASPPELIKSISVQIQEEQVQ